MSTRHTVKQGEDIASIAAKFGWLPQALWEHAENSELRQKRKDPNVLFPGDVVAIPDRRKKEVVGATEQRHRFRKKISARVKLRFMDGDAPMSGMKYVLDVAGVVKEGQTDGDGWLNEPLPANAQSGVVYLGEKRLPFPLTFGSLDPATEVSGAQARLKNLGYYKGEIDNALSADTANALQSFQHDQGLQESGKLDSATQEKLTQVHGG